MTTKTRERYNYLDLNTALNVFCLSISHANTLLTELVRAASRRLFLGAIVIECSCAISGFVLLALCVSLGIKMRAAACTACSASDDSNFQYMAYDNHPAAHH